VVQKLTTRKENVFKTLKQILMFTRKDED